MPRIANLLVSGWKMLLSSDLARSSAIVLLIRATNVVTAVGLSIVLIRLLGLKGYGLYAVYMSIFALVVMPLTAGMPNFIVKEVAPMFAERNGGQIKAVMLFFLRTAALYMAVAALVLAAAWYWRIAWQYRSFGILMWFHVGIQILNAGRSAVLRAIGRIVKGQLAERLIQPALTLGFTIAGWLALGRAFNVLDALVAPMLSGVIALVLGGYWIRQELGGLLSHAVREPIHRDWLKTVINLSGVGLLGSAFVNGVVLIVSWAGSLETAALYRIASAVAVVLNYLQEVMAQVVAPRIAQLWHAGHKEGLVKILMVGVVGNSGAIGIGTVALALAGREVLKVAYGAEYQQAYGALVILSCSTLAFALGGYKDVLLYMSGHAKAAFHASCILVPCGLALAAAGVLAFGEFGAAWAVLFYQSAATIWLTLSTKKFTGIDPSIFGLWRNRVAKRTRICSSVGT
jgi:O-antigen/teichoic acid export membrane protein